MNLSYALWLAVSGAIFVGVALTAWQRRGASAAALPLVALMSALAFWAFAHAISWLVQDEMAALFWLRLSSVGVMCAPPLFLIMTLRFLDISLSRKAYGALLVIPALSLLLLWTDSWHHLFFGNFPIIERGSIVQGGPWFYIHLIYLNMLMVAAVFVLLRAYARSSRFCRPRIALMLAGALFFGGANLYLAFRSYSIASLDWTPIAFTFLGILFAYDLFDVPLIDLMPGVRDALVESLDDAIVVVDTNWQVVDINSKALDLVDDRAISPLGKPLSQVSYRWKYIYPAFQDTDGRLEVRIHHASLTHIDLRVITIKDRHGTALGKLITWRDISARKQVEERLRVFFRAVEQNPAAIVITDPDGRIEYVNPQFVRLTEYTLEDVRGKTPRVLKSGETLDSLYEDLWKTIKAGQVWEGEILNRKKNGDLYWAHQLIAPVLTEEGEVSHFIAMQQDITERKRNEAALQAANERLQAQLVEIENLHVQLQEEAIRDGLTRLFNRRYLEETLEREISHSEREPRSISAVMIDVDRFKIINDTYGHQAGDAVLQTLGALLLENTRISDIACRYGGDEMLVVMPGAGIEAAAARAEEWRMAFSQMTFQFGRVKISTTLSMGVASFPEQARSSNELLLAADQALYWAKKKRDRVVRYDPFHMARGRHRSDALR